MRAAWKSGTGTIGLVLLSASLCLGTPAKADFMSVARLKEMCSANAKTGSTPFQMCQAYIAGVYDFIKSAKGAVEPKVCAPPGVNLKVVVPAVVAHIARLDPKLDLAKTGAAGVVAAALAAKFPCK